MSLSQEPAYSDLKSHFVCGFRNIMGERYAGNSGTHTTRGNAVDTTNGAGAHNIQMFVMNPDGTVIHCLPGYWNPRDLASELEFARKLNNLYENPTLNTAEKDVQYKNLQLSHVHEHSPDMVARSQLQHFDMRFEATHRRFTSDTIKDPHLLDGEWGPNSCMAFKTTDQIMHERMAARPFLSYKKFDVAKFADYGQQTYDKHEDSLDENGRMVGESHDIDWIKTGSAIQAATVATRPRQHAPRKVYVHTYGTVRPEALQKGQ